MNRFFAPYAGFTLAAVSIFISIPAIHAQVAFNGTDAYLQEFNTLPKSGEFIFVNDTTLKGWYSSVTAGWVSNGATSGDAPIGSGSNIYSWGAVSGSDRSLGIFSRNSSAYTGRLGLQMQNTSGATIDAVTLTFNVEQWRRNSGGATLSFGYLTTAESGSQLTASNYTTDTRGGLTDFNTSGSGGTDGNNSTYQQRISFTLSGLDWKSGEYLWLRWNFSSAGNAVGIGLDDLKVSAIPEPSAVAIVFGVTGLLAIASCHRR